MRLILRRGDQTDAAAAADLWLRARHAARPAIPAAVHSDEEVRSWFVTHVVPLLDLWIAESDDGELRGILVLDGAWLAQLYVDPSWTGRGIGGRLIELAKRERPLGLHLWTFVSNERAQRFYERNGFVEIDRTDGHANEEHAPDIEYAWRAI